MNVSLSPTWVCAGIHTCHLIHKEHVPGYPAVATDSLAAPLWSGKLAVGAAPATCAAACAAAAAAAAAAAWGCNVAVMS